MCQLDAFAPAILETVLSRLAVLFLAAAGGDLIAARIAARQMLDSYSVQTPNELCLAAEIISFSLHAVATLSSASDPVLPPNTVARLCNCAARLSRQGCAAERKLDQLKRARQPKAQPRAPLPDADTGAVAPSSSEASPAAAPAPPSAAPPSAAAASDLVETARAVLQAVAKGNAPTWSKSFQKRQAAKRIAENLKRNQSKHQVPAAGEPQAVPAP